jgi:hypothetical protein
MSRQLAIYAAVVGTVGTLTGVASLLWQMLSARRRRETRLRVSVSNMITIPQGTWCVAINAINESDFPVRVTSAGFQVQGHPGRTAPIIHQPEDASLPGIVAPKDRCMTYAPMVALEEAGLTSLNRLLPSFIRLMARSLNPNPRS